MNPATAPSTGEFPRLREDVVLVDGGVDGTGAPGFVLHDPLRHRFFRLSKSMAEVFRDWPSPEVSDPEEVKALAEFLVKMRLVETPKSEPLLAEKLRQHRSLVQHLIHSYLSFRVPLVNPEPFLDACLPFARLLASRVVVWSVVALGLFGMFVAGRQWQHFHATFLDFFSPAGAAMYGVTLVGLKVFHELGHGFVARHFGCHVPVMGINFMVMTPMLYTEASDAWRLSSRRQRFLIGAAGVLVEMALAALALLAWAFLPDGPMRSAAYFVAATAWIMSLAVNLSPFMRFDGYHMLADATGLHGIGPRAFALATWSLRELLFKTGEAMPEFHPTGRRRFLIALAVGTWIYRIGLFGGMALLVYHMLPKVVGVPMALIEIHWFLVRPVIRELKEWKGMGLRRLFSSRRAVLSGFLLSVVLVVLVLPLDRHVSFPAVLVPAQETPIFAPEAAEVLGVAARSGLMVAKGEVLAELAMPEIAQLQRRAGLRLALVEEQLARLAADSQDRAQRHILEQQRAAVENELRGLAQRQARLVIRAPFAGRITLRDDGLAVGQWVAADTLLLHLVAPQQAVVSGLVPERESARLTIGSAARFIGEDGMSAAVEAKLRDIGNPGGEGQTLTYLSAKHGGVVATAPDSSGREVPVQGYLPVVLETAVAAPTQVLRGSVVVEAAPQSVMGLVAGRVVTVLLRESGF